MATDNISSGDIKQPDDYLFVSGKHWKRKTDIQNGNGSRLASLVGRPGPITGIVLKKINKAD